ncbi:hypothetical protein I4U23_004169 [Adineta vaga]|nr:hypothetical protein I4U23_004169 [Adineta vaga]
MIKDILLPVLLPVSISITCYRCSSGSSGCDPFQVGGTGVSSTTSGQAVCYRITSAAGSTSRGGYLISSSCVATITSTGRYGTYCCYTNYCNGALSNYREPFLIIVTLLTLIISKHRWI